MKKATLVFAVTNAAMIMPFGAIGAVTDEVCKLAYLQNLSDIDGVLHEF